MLSARPRKSGKYWSSEIYYFYSHSFPAVDKLFLSNLVRKSLAPKWIFRYAHLRDTPKLNIAALNMRVNISLGLFHHFVYMFKSKSWKYSYNAKHSYFKRLICSYLCGPVAFRTIELRNLCFPYTDVLDEKSILQKIFKALSLPVSDIGRNSRSLNTCQCRFLSGYLWRKCQNTICRVCNLYFPSPENDPVCLFQVWQRSLSVCTNHRVNIAVNMTLCVHIEMFFDASNSWILSPRVRTSVTFLHSAGLSPEPLCVMRITLFKKCIIRGSVVNALMKIKNTILLNGVKHSKPSLIRSQLIQISDSYCLFIFISPARI
jgi:hypothetical protein